MKKLLAIILSLVMLLALAACDGGNSGNSQELDMLSYEDLQTGLNSKSAVAVNARISTLSDGSKMLMADVKNNSIYEITDIVLSFAVWDANGAPVLITTPNLPNNTYWVFEVTVSDVTVASGETWTADAGLELAEDCGDIYYVQAIVCSCKVGVSDYSNTLYDSWKDSFFDTQGSSCTGKSLPAWLMEEMGDCTAVYETPTTDPVLSDEEIFEQFMTNLAAQNAYTVNPTVYRFGDGSIYLLTDIQNNTNQKIQAISIAFAAWDNDGNPILLKGVSSTSESYVKVISYGDNTVEAGQYWYAETDTDVIGYPVSSELSDITYLQTIIVSYTAEDGTAWENPLYDTWTEYFVGNTLEDWMIAEAEQ